MESLKECLMGTTFRILEKNMLALRAQLHCDSCATSGELLQCLLLEMAVMLLSLGSTLRGQQELMHIEPLVLHLLLSTQQW